MINLYTEMKLNYVPYSERNENCVYVCGEGACLCVSQCVSACGGSMSAFSLALKLLKKNKKP